MGQNGSLADVHIRQIYLSPRALDGETVSLPSGVYIVKVGQNKAQKITTANVSEQSTVWLDTSYHIPLHYGLDDETPHGLPVRTETKMNMKGQKNNGKMPSNH